MIRTLLALLLTACLAGAQAEPMPAEEAAPNGVVVFAPRSATWDADGKAIIEKLATQSLADSANWIRLDAYTNDLGGAEMNLALGQRRIENIERELTLAGVPAHRIHGTSYKDERGGDTGLPMRRVEVRIQRLGG